MSWDERNGILAYKNGYVEIGFNCSRCDAHAQVSLPQDDYEEDDNLLCNVCYLRDRLAREIKLSRYTKKKALEIIKSLEVQLSNLLVERQNYDSLVQGGSKIIVEQDNIIRDLKNRLDKNNKKK